MPGTGSGITGNKVTLAAQNDLLLQAASNNSKQTNETGFGIQGSGYASKVASDGKTTAHVNTRVNAHDNLTLSSGRNTVLSGAQALGDNGIGSSYWTAATAISGALAGLTGGDMSQALAGSVAGNSAVAAGTGAQAGKTAVENNALSVPDNKARAQEMTQCLGGAACENAVIEKHKRINAEQHESVVGCKGAQECVNKANELASYKLIMQSAQMSCWRKRVLMAA